MKEFVFLYIWGMTFTSGVQVWAQTGLTSSDPIRFEHIRGWLDDSRPSLALLEETLRTDMLASRAVFQLATEPRYIKMANSPVSKANLFHMTYQGMFWGPVFSALVWTPPALAIDALTSEDDSEMVLTQLVWTSVMMNAEAQQENVFADLIRFNIVFTTDVVGLLNTEATAFDILGAYNLSRTYMGLAIKLLELNFFFSGFSFVHVPYLEGWESYFQDGSGDTAETVVEENSGITVGQLFFYNNFMDFLSLGALLDLGAEQVLEYLGVGLHFNIFETLRPDFFFNYIQGIDRYSLDTKGDLKLLDSLYFHWKWNLPLNVWRPQDDLRLGATLALLLEEDEAGDSMVTLRGDFITYVREGVQKTGYFGELGLILPYSTRFIVGASMNADDVTKRLPFSEDVVVIHFRAEIGMDGNFDGRFNARKKDALGFGNRNDSWNGFWGSAD